MAKMIQLIPSPSGNFLEKADDFERMLDWIIANCRYRVFFRQSGAWLKAKELKAHPERSIYLFHDPIRFGSKSDAILVAMKFDLTIS